MKSRALLPVTLAACLAAACSASAPTSLATMQDAPPDPSSVPDAAPAAREDEERVVVGQTTREEVLAAVPDWAQTEGESRPDPEACRGLAAVEPGAEIDVFLGTWCGDSRREVPRFWRALDLAGPAVPFEVHYIGVDRRKKEPSAPVTNNEILYVPTFIVRRNGEEVGRIVEGSPAGVEKDLLSLLSGQRRGVISTRPELTSSP